MVSCFSWFLRDTHASCGRHTVLVVPTQPWGPAGRPSPVPRPRRWACSPRPWSRMRLPLPRQPSAGCVYLCVCVGASVCVQCSRGWKWVSGRGDAGVRRGEAGDGRGEAGDGRREAGDGRAGVVPLLLGRLASTEPLVPNLVFKLRRQPGYSAFYNRNHSDGHFQVFVQNLHFTDSPSRVFSLWTGTEALCVEPGGLS